MKFNIIGNQFFNAINKLNYVIPSRSVLPILENIMFELRGNVLKLLASDLEIFIRTKVEVEGIEDGEIAVPSKDLINLIRTLSSNLQVTETIPNFGADMISEELRTYDLFIEKFKIDFGKKQLILKGLITQEEKDRLINIAANEIIEEAIDNLYIKFEEFSKHNKISVIANEKNKITVKTKKGKYTLSGESTEEFPAPEEKEDLNKIEFNNINFRKYLSTTIHAASTDDLRKNMAGILLDIRGKDIRMVATDGFRLCKYTTQKAKHKISKSEKVIIPHKTCSLILKLSEGEKSVIEFDSSMIKVIFDSTEIFSKLIDENFPNYETVIPKDNDKILKINRRDFQESLERIKIFADESTHRIKLEIKNSELNIKADNPEKGAEGEDSLDCSFIKNDSQDADFDAEPFNIAFNAGYLLECIKQINTDDVIFSFSTTSKASIATPSEQEGDEEYMELVMPVRVG